MMKIFSIWKKELKDTIRDRRTLMSMIVLPMVLMPLLIVGMGKFALYQVTKSAEREINIAVINAQAAPELDAFLKQQPKVKFFEADSDISQQVKSGEIDAAVFISDDFRSQLNANQPVSVKVLRNSIDANSGGAVVRLNAAFTAFNQQVLEQRLSERQISTGVLTGVVMQPEDVATEQERGGYGLAFLLPLFIVMWSIVGGQYTAIDVSAGEKERKTLESLLLAPVSRMEIVMGKFLAVSTAALTSVVIALGSMYYAVAKFGMGILQSSSTTAAQSSGLNFTIDPIAILILFAASILLVLMFSAVLLSVAIFAKSYKEAQSYVGPAYLIVILPVVIVNTIPSFKPALWFFLLPAVNAIQLFKEVMIGSYDPAHIAVTFVSLAIFSALAITVATRIYQKEGVLFRD